MTLGLGYPVTLQTNLAVSPSLMVTASGLVTKQGLNLNEKLDVSMKLFVLIEVSFSDLSSVSLSTTSGARCHPASISRILSMLAMPFGSCDS